MVGSIFIASIWTVHVSPHSIERPRTIEARNSFQQTFRRAWVAAWAWWRMNGDTECIHSLVSILGYPRVFR